MCACEYVADKCKLKDLDLGPLDRSVCADWGQFGQFDPVWLIYAGAEFSLMCSSGLERPWDVFILVLQHLMQTLLFSGGFCEKLCAVFGLPWGIYNFIWDSVIIGVSVCVSTKKKKRKISVLTDVSCLYEVPFFRSFLLTPSDMEYCPVCPQLVLQWFPLPLQDAYIQDVLFSA